jgi:hypothetical protein
MRHQGICFSNGDDLLIMTNSSNGDGIFKPLSIRFWAERRSRSTGRASRFQAARLRVSGKGQLSFWLPEPIKEDSS